MSRCQPIFVMGSARSGTTLLASIIGNAPCTANYRAEPLLLHGCSRRYGPLANPAAKKRFLTDWMQSRQFLRSGLPETRAAKLVEASGSYPALLRAFMDEVATSQGRTHWIDSTPSNVFELRAIRREFPDAKVINIVRDGRAVAASLRKLGWTVVKTASPWSALQYAALKWEAAVTCFQRDRDLIAGQVFETTYEAMISEPQTLIPAIWAFLGFDPAGAPTPETATGADGIQVTSNSAFGQLGSGISTEPLTRWRKQLGEREVDAIERLVGDTLVQSGYELIGSSDEHRYPALPGVWRRQMLRLRDTAKATLPFRFLYSTPLEIGVD